MRGGGGYGPVVQLYLTSFLLLLHALTFLYIAWPACELSAVQIPGLRRNCVVLWMPCHRLKKPKGHGSYKRFFLRAINRSVPRISSPSLMSPCNPLILMVAHVFPNAQQISTQAPLPCADSCSHWQWTPVSCRDIAMEWFSLCSSRLFYCLMLVSSTV